MPIATTFHTIPTRVPGMSSASKGCTWTWPSPAAHENEIDGDGPTALVRNGCYCVSEGANMPSTREAIQVYQDCDVLHGPAKAANAGGVATSGLEMSQNSMRLSWSSAKRSISACTGS